MSDYDEQGHNQVYSQRWATLENFPLPDCFPRRLEVSILVHPKQISVVSKSDKQKKKF